MLAALPASAVARMTPAAAVQMMDGVKSALVTLTRIDAVKDIRDKAQAIAAYAKQRGDGLEVQNSAAEVKLRAERRMGQLLAVMPKNEGAKGNPNGQGARIVRLQDATAQNPTLADYGIEKTLSHRCQQVAAVPDDVFEAHIRSTVEQKDELTTAAVLKIANRQKITDLRDSFERMGKAGTQGGGRVVRQDASAFLQSIEAASVDLLLTDPPYMTDCPGDVHTFAQLWLPMALSRIKPTGRAYVCIGAYPDELLAYLSAPRAGLELADVLVWTYRNTLGPAPTHHYKLNWQAVLHFQGADAPPLDCPLMNEQFSVQDISAPDGRRGERWHAWQKPDELAERLIRHSTQPGALIIDPFAGTGTFLAAAARLGRFAAGSEPDPAMLDLCAARGLEVCNAK